MSKKIDPDLIFKAKPAAQPGAHAPAGFVSDEYDEVIIRGNTLEDGIIHFFINNNKIVGACGLGLMGKVGRDIRISSKLIEKNTSVDKKTLIDPNTKLNKLIKN